MTVRINSKVHLALCMKRHSQARMCNNALRVQLNGLFKTSLCLVLIATAKIGDAHITIKMRVVRIEGYYFSVCLVRFVKTTQFS